MAEWILRAVVTAIVSQLTLGEVALVVFGAVLSFLGGLVLLLIEAKLDNH